MLDIIVCIHRKTTVGIGLTFDGKSVLYLLKRDTIVNNILTEVSSNCVAKGRRSKAGCMEKTQLATIRFAIISFTERVKKVITICHLHLLSPSVPLCLSQRGQNIFVVSLQFLNLCTYLIDFTRQFIFLLFLIFLLHG